MKKKMFLGAVGTLLLALTLIPVASTGEVTSVTSNWGDEDGGDFRGPCGDMIIIKVMPEETGPPLPRQTGVVDAWTTSTPHIDPYDEVYTFQIGADTLAFVTEYFFEEGGYIPLQYIRVWDCETLHKRSTCQYNWSLGPLPPGFTWLLINYYPPENVPNVPGEYDWATRVGDSTFGFPEPWDTRPFCFSLSN